MTDVVASTTDKTERIFFAVLPTIFPLKTQYHRLRPRLALRTHGSHRHADVAFVTFADC